MRSKKAISLILLLVFLLSCDSQESGRSAAGTNDDERPVIALVMKSLANEFFVNMASGAERHQAERENYELIINGIRNESDLAQQVALVDQMISRGVDAIVIAPADSQALVPALARASAAGIVIVNIDNRLEPEVLEDYGLSIPFIGPSNRAGAKMVGDFALQNVVAGSKVAILEGITSAVNSIERRTGFEEAITDAGMNLVTLQSAEWDQTKAAQVMAGILSQYPDLDVILAANDNMALGAASAVGMARREKEIVIAGFDNISAVHPLIEAGTVIATVDQFGDQLAVFGIEYAIEALESGAELEDRETLLELVTVETL
tara:strand:- start:383 stop:1339 length:957 start_codon:yes stop_codon:yes gene_type:complete